MLVLTRRLLEKVYIGEEISVTIVRLEGGQVRLGIEAPRAIPVVRAELKARHATPEPIHTPESDEPPVVKSPKTVPLGTGIRRRGLSR